MLLVDHCITTLWRASYLRQLDHSNRVVLYILLFKHLSVFVVALFVYPPGLITHFVYSWSHIVFLLLYCDLLVAANGLLWHSVLLLDKCFLVYRPNRPLCPQCSWPGSLSLML